MPHRKYIEMVPILILARCPRLGKRAVDDRVFKVAESPEYLALKKLYEEHPPSFWANLYIFGRSDALDLLDQRKREFRKLWHDTYKSQDQKSEDQCISE